MNLSSSSCLLLLVTIGCGPTYMRPPTTLQQPPVYPAPMQVPASPRPAVPPDGATARSLSEIPEANPSDVFLPPRSTPTSNYHRVVTGETLSSLAKRYGVSVEELRKANAWSADHQLRDGDLVQIPK